MPPPVWSGGGDNVAPGLISGLSPHNVTCRHRCYNPVAACDISLISIAPSGNAAASVASAAQASSLHTAPDRNHRLRDHIGKRIVTDQRQKSTAPRTMMRLSLAANVADVHPPYETDGAIIEMNLPSGSTTVRSDLRRRQLGSAALPAIRASVCRALACIHVITPSCEK